MSSEDKARNKAEEVKGSAKEKAGDLTGNEQWQTEGATEKASGSLKQALAKVKDAFGGARGNRRN